jgi:hypothetical protein
LTFFWWEFSPGIKCTWLTENKSEFGLQTPMGAASPQRQSCTNRLQFNIKMSFEEAYFENVKRINVAHN